MVIGNDRRMSQPFEVLDLAQGGDQALGRVTDRHLFDSKHAERRAFEDMLALINNASGTSSKLALLDEEAVVVPLYEAVWIQVSVLVGVVLLPWWQGSMRRRRRRRALDRVRQKFKVGMRFLWWFKQGARLDAIRGRRDQSAVDSRGGLDAVLPLSAKGSHLRCVWNLFKVSSIVIVIMVSLRRCLGALAVLLVVTCLVRRSTGRLIRMRASSPAKRAEALLLVALSGWQECKLAPGAIVDNTTLAGRDHREAEILLIITVVAVVAVLLG